jgi:phosphoribosylamine--glycine ligase
MEGKEVSLMFFVDANTVVPMVSARDHKRVFDNDQGPNTGGMGAFAPVEDFAKAGMAEVVERTIVRPTLAELQNRGITYRGVLYVGLMMTAEGPKVVEFNARFGDPETEVVLPLLKTDFFEILWAVTEDALADVHIEWEDGAAVCVVLTAAGYPASPRTGDTITMDLDGLDGSLLDDGVGRDLADRPTERTAEIAVFHAGTAVSENRLVTVGGRVLTVTGKATTLNEARKIAYAAAEKIYFDGKHMRRDIAQSGSTDCDNAQGFGRRM